LLHRSRERPSPRRLDEDPRQRIIALIITPTPPLGAIDDATSRILALDFRPTEDLHGYAVIFDQVFRQYGLLLAVYGDRLNILVRNDDH
jgi:hypothetical protein